MRIRSLVLLLVFSFFVMTLAQFCIPQLPLAYAQEEEPEEEEPEEEDIQSKPNPMETTTRGISAKSTMQKGALKMEAASTKTSEVMEEGEQVDAVMSEGAEGVSTEIVSMPIDPYDTEVGTDSLTGTSSVMQEGVGSTSWDPSDSPAGWDPFDKEANLDSAEMMQ